MTVTTPSATTVASGALLDEHTSAAIRQEVAGAAADVDLAKATPTAHFATLAGYGLLDVGISERLAGSPSANDVRTQGEVISLLAEECMCTAFSVWAHRMCLDYLSRGRRSGATDELLHGLRCGRRIGATAMASGIKALSGLEALPVKATRDGGGYLLHGAVRWASNLVPGAVVVLPAEVDDGTRIVARIEIGDPGVSVRAVTGLLALDASASGSIALDGVQVPADAVISDDFTGFATDFRPTLLLLQSAFCLGLAVRSLHETAACPGAESLAEDQAALTVEHERLTGAWLELAADITAAPVRGVLQLRLDASRHAIAATRLEATAAGGRGYLTRSGANRRLREAAFLPVQSPSEGQLRWDIASLAS